MKSILLLLLVTKSASENLTRIIDITSQVLLMSFPSRRLVIYIGDKNVIIYKALYKINAAVVNCNDNKCVADPDGYVVYFRNQVDYETTFSSRFLPHKTISVFSTTYIDPKIFRNLTELEGNQVIYTHEFGGASSYTLDVNSNEVIAKYKSSGGLLTDYKYKTLKWRPNFRNSTFKVSAFNFSPVLTVTKNKLGGLEKYIIDNIVGDWTLEIYELPPLSWHLGRSLTENRTCDLSLGGYFRNFIKTDVTPSYMLTTSTLLVPKPKLFLLGLFLFSPFNTNLWICLIIFVLLFSAIYYCYFKRQITFIALFLDVLGTLCSNVRHRLAYIRFVLILLSILTIVTTTSYSAGFTSNMASPRFSRPINTFEDVWANSLTYSYPNLKEMMSSSASQHAQMIAVSLFAPNKVSQLYAATIIERFIVLEDSNVPEHIRKTLKVLEEKIGDFKYVLVLQKNSPFTKLFSEKVVKFVEHGLIQAWFRFTIYENSTDFRNMVGYFSYYTQKFGHTKSLELRRFQGLFYMLFFCHFLSALAFICEKKLLFPGYLQN